jgi:hypothetical protein
MISAEKAREITAKAVADQRAYDRAMIERESERACEEIRYAADRGYAGCEVSTNGFDYPKGVTKYLSEELGYSAEYNPDRKVISVSW